MQIRHVIAVLIFAGGVALATAPAHAQCASGVRWHGVVYTGVNVASPVELAGSLSGGVTPGCDDAIAIGPDGERVNEPPPDKPVSLAWVHGVRSIVAVARPDQPETVFLAPGFLPQLRSHPLHAALYARPGDVEPAKACRRRATISGRAAWQPGIGLRFVVRAGRREHDIFLRPATRYRGRLRAGLPFVAKGDRLKVTGPRCRVAGYNGIVARTISAQPD